jgi:thiosulfate/3-mercaptopyruvate sulfurtransferase
MKEANLSKKIEVNLQNIKIPSEEIFVDTQWIADHLNDQGLRIVELHFTRCLSNHDVVKKECLENYLSGHIPGAVYVDCMEDLTDPSFKEIFYVAPSDHIAKVLGRAGINNQTMVVCYDEGPYPLASARFWWTLHYYGHTRVKILDGGIRKWIKEGRPLSSQVLNIPFKQFNPKVQESIRATKEIVIKGIKDPETIIIDSLTFRKYTGEILNTWSTRKGHIPSAIWVSAEELVEGLDHASSTEIERAESYANDEPYSFFPVWKLRRIFSKAGVQPGKRVITYCGKGDGACSVFIALKMIGIEDVAVYDGSLAEWSRDLSLPLEVYPGYRK